MSEKKSDSAAKKAVKILAENKLKLCAAESCTGGLIADEFVSVSGASDVFMGSCVTYQTPMKTKILGLDARKIRKFGVVSEETALSMAEGALELFGADIALASTGYAETSPDSKVPDGTIFIALAAKNGAKQAIKMRCLSTRNRNRKEAARSAVGLLLNFLSGV